MSENNPKKKPEWQVWLGIAAIWYILLAFMLFDWDESFPAWGVVAFYVFSPVIVGVGLVMPVAFCVFLTKAEKLLAPYYSKLANIENRQKKALREGRKRESRWLKVAYWIVAIPIVILIYLIAGGAAARYE
jgi:Mn2+/Fe2+ NRAMP family transporter